MAGYRMPRGYAAFLSGVSLLVWSIVGLLTVLVSWAIGGKDFKDVIFGNAAMALFVVGAAVGAWLVHWAQHHGHRSSVAPPVTGDRRQAGSDRRQTA